MKIKFIANQSKTETNLIVTVTIDKKKHTFSKNIPTPAYDNFINKVNSAKELSEIEQLFGAVKIDKSKEYTTGIVKVNGEYFWNSDTPLPDRFLKEIKRYKTEGLDITPLENFWRLLEKSPDENVRNYAMRFIADSNLSITPGGCFISYRHVVNNNDSEIYDEVLELKRNISKEFLKSLYKKDLHNRALYMSDGGKYFIGSENKVKNCVYVKSLKQAYLDYVIHNIGAKDIVFTDAHTGKQQILIGQDYSIDRNLCDPNPQNSCSSGLHVGTEHFVNQNNFGNVPIVCLIVPFDIVCVPHGYADSSKMRVCSMFILGEAVLQDRKLIPFEPGTYPDLKRIEEEYITRRLEVLKNTIMTIGMVNNSYGIPIVPKHIRNNSEYIAELTNYQKEIKNRNLKGYGK